MKDIRHIGTTTDRRIIESVGDFRYHIGSWDASGRVTSVDPPVDVTDSLSPLAITPVYTTLPGEQPASVLANFLKRLDPNYRAKLARLESLVFPVKRPLGPPPRGFMGVKVR